MCDDVGGTRKLNYCEIHSIIFKKYLQEIFEIVDWLKTKINFYFENNGKFLKFVFFIFH